MEVPTLGSQTVLLQRAIGVLCEHCNSQVKLGGQSRGER